MAKLMIWSPMKGRVSMNGLPAAGAVLVRHFEGQCKDAAGSDRMVADPGGEFSSPSIERSSLRGSILPHGPVIEQAMAIEYKGVTDAAWNHCRGSDMVNAENDARPIDLTCRLDAARVAHGYMAGLCGFA